MRQVGKFAIYGFRLKGCPDVRYVGLTGVSPESRLRRLTKEAEMYGRRATTGIGGWLLDNRDNIEVFLIVRTRTLQEARVAERTAIAALVEGGHRLLNRWLVPVDKRIDWIAPRYLAEAA